MVVLFQHCLNLSLHVLGLGHGRETLDEAAVLRDEELGEIPAHTTFFATFGFAQAINQFHRGFVFQSVDFFGRYLLCQILENRVGILAKDVDFLHQREGHAVVEAAELGFSQMRD